MKRFAVLIVGGAAAALFVRLGFWQLDRLAERRAANARGDARLAQASLDLGPGRANPAGVPDSLALRRAVARGVLDFEHQIIIVARSVEGVPAVHVTTPLLLADGRAILVERGWVYSPDGRQVDLAALRESDSAAVSGVLLTPVAGRSAGAAGADWPLFATSNNPTQLAERFPYPLLPAVLRRTEQPPGVPAAFRPVPLPPMTDGPHLSYAIQWFAFAAIALIGSVALFRSTGARYVVRGG